MYVSLQFDHPVGKVWRRSDNCLVCVNPKQTLRRMCNYRVRKSIGSKRSNDSFTRLVNHKSGIYFSILGSVRGRIFHKSDVFGFIARLFISALLSRKNFYRRIAFNVFLRFLHEILLRFLRNNIFYSVIKNTLFKIFSSPRTK